MAIGGYNLNVPQEDRDLFESRGDGRTLTEALQDHQRESELTAVQFKRSEKAVVIRYSDGLPKGQRKIRMLAGPFIALLCGSYLLAALSPEARNTLVMAVCGVGLLVAAYLIFTAVSHVQVKLDRYGLSSSPKPFGAGPKVKATLKEIRRFRVKKTVNANKKKRYHLVLVDRNRKEHIMIKNVPRKSDAYLMALLLIDITKKLCPNG